MNKKNLSLKVNEYTIHLHRGQEETEEMGQKRMVLLISCLCNIALRPLIKCLKENYPELQFDIDKIKKVQNICPYLT